MIRILQIGLSFECGGIESFVMNYYRNIDRTKVQFDFVNVYNRPLAYQEEMIELGAQIHYVPDFHISPLKYRGKLMDVMKGYSVVHIHMLSAANLLPLMVAKQCGVMKIIAHAHNTSAEGFLRTILHLINFRKINKLSTQLFACSGKAGDWMYGKNKRFDVIKNAIDITKYQFDASIRTQMRQILGISESAVVYGNVGRLNIQKNQLFLLDVFRELVKKQGNAILCIVGEGELKEVLESKIKKLGLEKNVRLLGIRSDMNRVYNALDAIIMPSLFEGLPISLIEAQANGLKCYVSEKCVPLESKIIESMEFISLKTPADVWAKKIIEGSLQRDDNAVNILTQNHYNIVKETETLLNNYLQ